MKNRINKLISAMVILALAALTIAMFGGCNKQEENNGADNGVEQDNTGDVVVDSNPISTDKKETNNEKEEKKEEEDMTENPKVVITMTDGKTIKLELFPEIAPITVANFLSLVDEKYYDGLIFHRIIGSFMIQGGGYYIKNETQFCSAPAKTPIKGEFSSNGVNNTLSHDAGVISMARTTVKDSATGQFFICTNGNNKASLDGNYAAFGRTIDQESMNNVLAIASVQTVRMTSIGMDDFPYPEIPTIQSIRRLG